MSAAATTPTLLRVTVVTDRHERSVAGTLVGEARPRLVEIKGIAVEADFAPDMLYVTNQDKPGFIGRFGMVLANAGINIATFHLGRAGQGGDAICLVSPRRADPGGGAGRGPGAAAGGAGDAAAVLRKEGRGEGILPEPLIYFCESASAAQRVPTHRNRGGPGRILPPWPFYSIRAPLIFTISASIGRCFAACATASSGVDQTHFAPVCRKRCCTAGSAAISFIAAFTLSTIGRGMPGRPDPGAPGRDDEVGHPASAMVGMFGSVGQRSGLVTA